MVVVEKMTGEEDDDEWWSTWWFGDGRRGGFVMVLEKMTGEEDRDECAVMRNGEWCSTWWFGDGDRCTVVIIEKDGGDQFRVRVVGMMIGKAEVDHGGGYDDEGGDDRDGS
ncbi:hypothetical protein Hanom_Chr09g00816031 [Helianthus anomalus]